MLLIGSSWDGWYWSLRLLERFGFVPVDGIPLLVELLKEGSSS